jgi:hypothetical protein
MEDHHHQRIGHGPLSAIVLRQAETLVMLGSASRLDASFCAPPHIPANPILAHVGPPESPGDDLIRGSFSEYGVQPVALPFPPKVFAVQRSASRNVGIRRDDRMVAPAVLHGARTLNENDCAALPIPMTQVPRRHSR